MTLDQFELHRPKLAASLKEMVQGSIVGEIIPLYERDELFRAHIDDGDQERDFLVCVSSNHILAFVEEDAPTSPTWWYASDLERLPNR